MKLIKQGLCLALLGTGLAVLPSATAGAAPDRPSIVERMRAEAEGTTRATTEDATGKVGFVRTTGDLMPSVRAGATAASAAAKATAYLDKYAAAFGARADDLEQAEITEGITGHVVKFTQTHQGLPVFGGDLRAHVDKQGDLTSVNGFVVPDISVPTTPRLDRDAATTKALELVKAQPAGHRRALGEKAAAGLQIAKADLMIYRMGAIQGVEGRNLLAWVVEVSNASTVRETVVLDAMTGKAVNRYSMIAHALDRRLYEEAYDEESPEENLVWREGDPFPGDLNEDQQNEVRGAGESYWLFKNTFGYDSYDNGQRSLEDDDPTNDGQGAPMITVNNDPNIDCPNANWNGTSTNYCDGVTGDDTVAHEWGHAYTEYTSGLLYQWQPGAMNEAYSDIWGETVDMLNARQNETEAEQRTPDDCAKYSLRPSTSIVITAPEEIAGECVAVASSGGPEFPTEPTEVTAIVGVDADTDGAGPTDTNSDGCSPFENAAELAGNWVYVDENLNSACGQSSYSALYEHLAANAEAAGAAGLIVGAWPGDNPWDMPGEFDIYAAQIDAASGDRIKSVAQDPVTLTVQRVIPTGYDRDSHRWLSGESDPAFGGAIRDMWNPTCYGDPGKVSDEEYYCATTDNGGVHSNSGVVNHAFALLVDGAEYNGVTVPAIGLDKAANLFWQAQTAHLTSVSGFPELADALQASCTELTGAPINELTLGGSVEGDGSAGAATPELADPITAADCAAVTAVIAATELREEPVQCNFQSMLDQGKLGCGTGMTSTTTYTEDFEDGLAGWTQDVEYAEWTTPQGPRSGSKHFDATATTDLPTVTKLPGGAGQHEGGASVLYFNDAGEEGDGNFGDCLGTDNDYSSRVGMASPAITIPAGMMPRLSFDHYMASEVGWDGGNVKYRVGDGEWTLVPTSAYLFNGPGTQLNSAADGNTNPMAGQDAFTGTDGGQPTGSWGTSYIDLEDLGDAGQTIQFRFDFGMDGCNGIDGWYVDNIAVSYCAVAGAPPATPQTASVVDAFPKVTKVKGKRFSVIVMASAAGKPVGGDLQILRGTKLIKRAALPTTGTATITVRGKFPKGKQTFTVKYLGTTGVAPSQDTFTLKVVKKNKKGKKGNQRR